MRGLKYLIIAAALLVPVALMPKANAQISINIGGPPPSCPYGYYGYAPYSCAPYGYYGPGYFYNGIFLGVGPWSNWGYRHGWGNHRFHGGGGGRYRPSGRAYHGHPNHNSRPAAGRSYNNGHAHGGARPGGGHQNAPRPASGHSSGGQHGGNNRGGGGDHGGGGHGNDRH